MTGIDVLYDVQAKVFYSKSHPARAASEVLFGWALYEKDADGTSGTQVGLTDQIGAAQWLDGKDVDSIEIYRVDGAAK